MTPAKEVGGDLYDFIIEDNELFFIIGDVAGKGVPASLYMAVTRTLFRNLAGNYQSAANIMREMNHAIASTNESLVFVTAFIGVLDLRTHHLTYCNAAHNAPALITADGACRLLHDLEKNRQASAIEEWVANVISYDYPKGIRGHVELTAKVVDNVLTLVIKDHGAPFDPTQQTEVDVDAQLDERQIGGLGIHLVKAIMDTMHYERTADGYNVLTLTKELKIED